MKASIKKLSEVDTPSQQKALILKLLGNLSQYDVLGEEVLVATYVSSNVLRKVTTKDGNVVNLYATDKTTYESQFQGKAALVIKKGDQAWKMNYGQPYEGKEPADLTWVAIIPGDGREIFLKDIGQSEAVACRLINFRSIKLGIKDPRLVW